MVSNLKEILSRPYGLKFELDGADWVASFDDDEFKKNNMVIGVGDSKDEAKKELFKAFECYVKGLESDPSLLLPRLSTQPTAQESRAKNVTITLKESIIAEIDAAAKRAGLTRSAFLSYWGHYGAVQTK